MKMKKVLIFGSTGSIGRNALDVIKRDPERFKVLGLCANKDTKTLARQIKEFQPSYVCVRDEKSAKKLDKGMCEKIKLFKGEKGLEEFSSLKSDISVMAISGIACLLPFLINLKYTKRVALANKESLVAAGALVFDKAKKWNTEIFPIDSEINALYQLIRLKQFYPGENDEFRKVYLTASGGALAGYSKKKFAEVSVKEVLNHPTWKMGKRVTVDSATLVNKGFEVVETHYFFGLPFEKIDILIHKESSVHALVECRDSTLFACIYPPDMKMPISLALYYPQRADFNGKDGQPENGFGGKNNFSCSFAPVNYERYPLLKLILQAAKKEDNSLAVLNACDEVAIDYFLKEKIKFMDIHKVMEYIFQRYPSKKIKNIEDVFYWDSWGRTKTKEYLERL